jgi:hypothetical protein
MDQHADGGKLVEPLDVAGQRSQVLRYRDANAARNPL